MHYGTERDIPTANISLERTRSAQVEPRFSSLTAPLFSPYRSVRARRDDTMKQCFGKSLCGFAPAIPMMQTAESRFRDHFRTRGRPTFNPSPLGCVFSKRVVNPIFVMVRHVIPNQPSQMLLVQRDDMIEQLAPAASHPAFRDPVLPGRLNTRALRLKPRRPQELDHSAVELGIVVQNGETIRTSLGKGLPQLLPDPLGIGMSGDMEVQNSAPAMLDYKEAVQELKSQCGYGKEIQSNDRLAMVLQEGPQTPRRIPSAAHGLSDTGPPSARRSPTPASAVRHGFS